MTNWSKSARVVSVFESASSRRRTGGETLENPRKLLSCSRAITDELMYPTYALIAASKVEQIEENVKTLENLAIDDIELKEIDQILTKGQL